MFFSTDAPDREAGAKNHDKAQISCEWITEVTMTTDDQFLSLSASNVMT